MAVVREYVLLQLTGTPLTVPQERAIRDELRQLGRDDDPMPDRILQIRVNIPHNKMIVKAYFPNGNPSRAQVVARIAAALGVGTGVVDARLAPITIFGTTAGDVFGGETQAVAYMQANFAEWETAPLS